MNIISINLTLSIVFMWGFLMKIATENGLNLSSIDQTMTEKGISHI